MNSSTTASTGGARHARDVAPAAVLADFAARLAPVTVENTRLAQAGGRVLARPLAADRDSPAADVSAMDGYAVHSGDFGRGGRRTLPVIGEARIGRAPPETRGSAAVRVVTGAPVPAAADAVLRREDVEEGVNEISIAAGTVVRPGQHVRRKGENVHAGDTVLPAGVEVTPAVAAVLAAFGAAAPCVRRRVRVGVIVTGDELRDVTMERAAVSRWQLRDANGPALCAMFGAVKWVEIVDVARVRDELGALEQMLASQLEECHAVFLTGGVSMGDRDYVPAAVQRVGAEVAFHRLRIRPGKPLLGAVGPRGQAILGLPGNPVSVLVTARRFGGVVLRRLAGFEVIDPPVPAVSVSEGAGGSADKPPMELWWYRPVRLTGGGRAALVPTRGSGDGVSAARGDGFIEVPPRGAGPGPWPLFGWSL